MQAVTLSHIIYASNATSGLDAEELKSIMRSAQARNADESITGLLVHSSGSFFQVLEGETATVNSTFLRIAGDPRHTNVVKIIEEPIARRDFGDWSMGYLDIETSELRQAEGIGDALPPGGSLRDLPAGRAKKLFAAFATGRWRGRVGASVP